MRGFGWAITFILASLASLGLLLHIVLLDLPVHFGMLFIDYPDPRRPGHLAGVTVSFPELALKVLCLVGCIWLVVYSWKSMRRVDPDSTS